MAEDKIVVRVWGEFPENFLSLLRRHGIVYEELQEFPATDELVLVHQQGALEYMRTALRLQRLPKAMVVCNRPPFTWREAPALFFVHWARCKPENPARGEIQAFITELRKFFGSQ